jgi:hypothetical protein
MRTFLNWLIRLIPFLKKADEPEDKKKGGDSNSSDKPPEDIYPLW